MSQSQSNADHAATAAPDAADEQAFVDRLKAGDEGAFEQLLRERGPKLLALARRILPDESHAQDAVQEAMITVYRRIGQFDGRSRLSTWLHRVTVNAALMRLRKLKRLPERSVDELLPRFSWIGYRKGHRGPWRAEPHAVVEQGERKRLVHEAIASLPQTHRDVLLLRDIQEMDTAQTAAELGINEGAVKTRLHRARQALRELLDPHFAQPRTTN